MMRSKLHRPWQPRVSDSQQFNPFAHSTESETSFSDEIEGVETAIHPVAEGQDAATVTGGASEELGAEPAVTSEAPKIRSAWYATLIERFTRH